MNLDELLPLVRPYVSGCPIPVQRAQVSESARRFCAQSQAWREIIYAGFGRGMKTSRLTPPESTVVVAIAQVNIKDQPRPLGAIASLDGLEDVMHTPTKYASERAGYLSLYPTPDSSIVCVVKAIVMPEISGTLISEEVGNNWGGAIADGAIANILLMPDTDWYNPEQSAFHRGRFEQGITEARISIATGSNTTGGVASGGQFI